MANGLMTMMDAALEVRLDLAGRLVAVQRELAYSNRALAQLMSVGESHHFGVSTT
jgi:hypothetical protein